MLGTAFNVVVVVVQGDIRIGFTRVLEGLKELIRSDDLKPLAAPEIFRRCGGVVASVIDRLVHDVPAQDLSFEVPHQRQNVIPQLLQHHFSRRILEEPGIGL